MWEVLGRNWNMFEMKVLEWLSFISIYILYRSEKNNEELKMVCIIRYVSVR